MSLTGCFVKIEASTLLSPTYFYFFSDSRWLGLLVLAYVYYYFIRGHNQ